MVPSAFVFAGSSLSRKTTTFRRILAIDNYLSNADVFMMKSRYLMESMSAHNADW
jgi:hypothetical protein